MFNNKKNLIIFGAVGLILIVAIILTIISRQKINSAKPANNLPAPEFLTAQEKAHFKLDNNVKAQVLNRDASGTPTVYKLINTDYDIIADPSKVGPISPHSAPKAN